MWRQILMAAVGLGGGMIAAGGIVALQIGLGITPRFAGVTHTADKILLYEDASMLGAMAGSVMSLFHLSIPLGQGGLLLLGLFSGVYLGGWILALAEMVDMFAVALRRLKYVGGISLLIMVIAVAKVLGSLYYFLRIA